MKTKTEIKENKLKKVYSKYYPGLYPPGAFVAWPNTEKDLKGNTHAEDGLPFRRTKAGGYIALPIGK